MCKLTPGGSFCEDGSCSTCSECGYEIRLSQHAYGGCGFYELDYGLEEKIKFCPHCGGGIVRFDRTPRFEERIDYTPLDVFSEARLEYERKCKWIWHCFISDDHREAIRAVLQMMETDKGVSGIYKDAAGAAILRRIPGWVEEKGRQRCGIYGLQKRFRRVSDGA